MNNHKQSLTRSKEECDQDMKMLKDELKQIKWEDKQKKKELK